MIKDATTDPNYCGEWHGSSRVFGRVPVFTDSEKEQLKIQDDSFHMYFDWIQTLPEPYFAKLVPRETACGDSKRVYNRSRLIVWMNDLYDISNPLDLYDLMTTVTESLIADYQKLISGYQCMHKYYEDRQIYSDRVPYRPTFKQMQVPDDKSCDS